jgi:hypothetical protein
MVTRQEVITSLHEPEKFILAIVPVAAGFAHTPRYVRGPLVEREPSFLETAISLTSDACWSGRKSRHRGEMTGISDLAPVPLEHLQSGRQWPSPRVSLPSDRSNGGSFARSMHAYRS